jgi:hypothetical protein
MALGRKVGSDPTYSREVLGMNMEDTYLKVALLRMSNEMKEKRERLFP